MVKLPWTLVTTLARDVGKAGARLERSWDARRTWARCRRHRWRVADTQYLFMALLGMACFVMMESPGFVVKSLAVGGLVLALLLPITSQFFLPALPVFSWLVLFLSCRFVPAEYRPRIWVSLLPTLENVLYGANISDILTIHTHWILDLLAWAPYGVVHFGAPFVIAAICFVWGPQGMIQAFGRAFGYLNLVGVMTQLVFPCSPPWYELIYGLIPANYSIPGSPGGLARIDSIFHNHTYTATFTASPLVFGAFPSLHAACATMEALFLSFLFPRYKSFFWIYVFWIWWACMYLTHHYFVDLVGGSCLATTVFFMVRYSSIWPVSDIKDEGGSGGYRFVNGEAPEHGRPLPYLNGGQTRSRYSMDELRPGSVSQSLLFDANGHHDSYELPTAKSASASTPYREAPSKEEAELALEDEIAIIVEDHDERAT